MQLIDCHTHTAYSGHGTGTLADAVAAAERLGLTALAATEHWTLPGGLDPLREDSMSPQDAERYLDELAVLRTLLDERDSKLELVIGAEVDWLGSPDAQMPLDGRLEFILGSVHFIDGLAVDNEEHMELWEELGPDGVWHAYLDEWLRMADSDLRFDAFAHPDLPKVFGNAAPPAVVARYADMADAAAAAGAMVELNTCGWRKPLAQPYPALGLLEQFCRAGVDCTVGSDGHSPDRIGYRIKEAYAVLYEAGYRRVAVPRPDGSRRYIEL